MAAPLIDLLKRALQLGAREVRLIPGRRTLVILPQGENEVRGDPQTTDKINALIEPVMTPEAKRHLASGWTEWEFDLEGRGPVRACAELKVGLVHVSLFLDRCDPSGVTTQALPQVSPPAPLPRIGTPRAIEPALTAPIRPTIEHVPEPPPLATQWALAPDQQVYDSGLSGGSTAAIDKLLIYMFENRGSDLHISTGAPPMFRKDGEMQPIPGYESLAADAVQRILLPIVPPRNREEFNTGHDTDFAYELPSSRFRANLFVDLRGMGGVFRVIPSKILTVEDLKLPKDLLSLCHLAKGLVVVTGPTGSGKSTTLAAMIDYINRNRTDHIITIEDPIEFVHPNKKCLINQRQVGEHTQSFKRALKAALREDPDIVLLGEMRDLETIAIALETAETGHLVFGTLHTSSAPSTIDRIIDQFPAEQQNQIRTMLAISLKGVIAQMLCKKIGGGRVAALEVMFGLPAVANLIREGKIFQIPSVMQTGRKLGMCMMNDSLLKHVKDGLVAPDEALSKANDKVGLITMFQQAKIELQNPVAAAG